MRKKMLTISLATALCIAGLTACGKTGDTDTPDTEAAVETEATTEEAAATTEAAADNSDDSGEDASSGNADASGDYQSDDGASTAVTGSGSLETPLWTLAYDDSVWSYDEDGFKDKDDTCSVDLFIPDPDEEDKKIVTIEVRAAITTPYAFRDDLYTYNIDEKEYVDNGSSLEHVNIGGVDLMKYEGQYWGSDSIKYFERFESANETINVRVYGDVENEEVQKVLDGLTFKVTDIGNEDGPWYWEGEPFNVGEKTVTVGDTSITSHFMKMDDPYLTHEVFKQRITVNDNKAYVLLEDNVKVYDIADGALTYNTEYTLPDTYASIMTTTDGRIYIGGNSHGLIEWKDGEVVNEYKGSDIKYIEMAPSGSFGISYFTSGDSCSKIEPNGDGTYNSSTISFPEVKTIQHLNVNDNHIFVCGTSSSEDGGATVCIYDTSGNLELELAEDGENIGIGSVTYVFETANCYVALDGNMRTIPVWGKDGSYKGRGEDSELFGTNYPWFCGSCIAPDGTFYTIMTEERQDKSADEAIVFTLSGF